MSYNFFVDFPLWFVYMTQQWTINRHRVKPSKMMFFIPLAVLSTLILPTRGVTPKISFISGPDVIADLGTGEFTKRVREMLSQLPACHYMNSPFLQEGFKLFLLSRILCVSFLIQSYIFTYLSTYIVKMVAERGL